MDNLEAHLNVCLNVAQDNEFFVVLFSAESKPFKTSSSAYGNFPITHEIPVRKQFISSISCSSHLKNYIAILFFSSVTSESSILSSRIERFQYEPSG